MIKVITDALSIEPLRIAVAGYIDLNVVDGSAFFLAGLTKMCSQCPGLNVDLVAATPIDKYTVIDEVVGLPNVSIIEPPNKSSESPFNPVRRLTRSQYARLLADLESQNSYDAIIIRDTETAFHFAQLAPSSVPKLSVYVTGIASTKSKIVEEPLHQLTLLGRVGARFLTQTEVMKEILIRDVCNISSDAVEVLPPHVPDSPEPFNELINTAELPTNLVYAGKFFPAWNLDKILASFKSVSKQNRGLRLSVAGDAFRDDPEDPFYRNNVEYLLRNTSQIRWYGSLSRKETRKLIQGSDVGISWRREELGESAELSTKILEYGSLGTPAICNRTPMHERLLGSDYPYFCNSMAEFKSILKRLGTSRTDHHEAADRCFVASEPYQYSRVFPSFLRFVTGSSGDVLVKTERGLSPLKTFNQIINGSGVIRGNELIITPEPNGVNAVLLSQMYRDYLDFWRSISSGHAGSRGVSTPQSNSDSESLAIELAKTKLELNRFRNSRFGKLQRKYHRLKRIL